MPAFDVAILLSAFEPVHLAHCAALDRGFASAERVLVLVGSAGAARTLRHPWTADERISMLRAAVAHSRWPALMVAPVRDHLYDEDAWRGEVQQAVTRFTAGAQRIAVLAAAAPPRALPASASWTTLATPGPAAPGFWDVRRGVFGNAPEIRRQLDAALPPSTRDFLTAYRAAPHFAALADELRYIEDFRHSWRLAPYPPVLVTTDALVLQAGHILLIRRGYPPGKGLWALPGGFVDQDETLLEACVRELHEETGLAVPTHVIHHALRGQRTFDAPHRSLRGRTITHAFRFDLPGSGPCAVAGGDDAAEAKWIALEQFARMESEMFEDHFHIACRMLG